MSRGKRKRKQIKLQIKRRELPWQGQVMARRRQAMKLQELEREVDHPERARRVKKAKKMHRNS